MILWDETKKTYGTDENTTRLVDKVVVRCDQCGGKFNITHSNHVRQMRLKGVYIS